METSLLLFHEKMDKLIGGVLQLIHACVHKHTHTHAHNILYLLSQWHIIMVNSIPPHLCIHLCILTPLNTHTHTHVHTQITEIQLSRNHNCEPEVRSKNMEVWFSVHLGLNQPDIALLKGININLRHVLMAPCTIAACYLEWKAILLDHYLYR